MYTQRTPLTHGLLAATMVAVFVISSCASLQFVATSATTAEIAVGDHVVVKTQNGENHEFTVMQITDTALQGDNSSISFADMASLQVKRRDTTRTVLLIVGVVAIAAAAGGGGGSGSGSGSGGSY